jgi:small subunit ribosomal protein S5
MIMLRPAAPGTGVIAGGTIRAIMNCAGVNDVLSKSMGSSNSVNIVKATMKALQELETPETVAARRGKSIEDVAKRSIVAKKNNIVKTSKKK